MIGAGSQVLFLIKKNDHLTHFEMQITGSICTILAVKPEEFPDFDYALQIQTSGIIIGANEDEISLWP